MKSQNVILGINWEQNSSAALMINGKIVGCTSEERFSRVKNDERYPLQSINYLIKNFSIKSQDINTVCFISEQWAPGYILTRRYTTMSIEDYIHEQKKVWYPRIYKKEKVSQIKVFKNKLDLDQYPGQNFWKKIIKFYQKNEDHPSNKKNEIIEYGKEIRRLIIKKHLNIPSDRVRFIDHSSGHIYYSFFSSQKIKSSLVVSMDAFGDNINYRASILKKVKNKIFIKDIVKGSNFIIGRLYRFITLIMGFKPNEHEYKIMGLAPYAKEKYYQKIKKIFFSLQDVKKLNFVNKSKYKDLYFQIKNLLDGQRFDAIAGGLQSYTEDLTIKWFRNLLLKYKNYNICLGGGVALNVKNNLQISKINKIKNIFVPPSPDDSSQSMGACYYNYINEFFNKDMPLPLTNAYLGYEISNEKVTDILKFVDKSKYQIIKKNINYHAVKLLIKKKIIARCSGKAEFGARALGNRSILAHPSHPEVKQNINEKIKNRDFWMPFAASVLDKYAKKYFVLKGNSENYYYMTNCVDTKKQFINKLSAAIHPYDYTCRPQVVKQTTNNEYYDLIKKFGDKSGVYALLNTSFNIHGHPLVNSEKDAIKVFAESNLDALILGNFLIIKKNN